MMTMTNYSDRTYAGLATQIARILWGLCDAEIEGKLVYFHACENNLNAPCDMLARLGLMRDWEVSHCFASDWSPFNEAALIRHPGEPTGDDLLLGLMFYTEWFPNNAAFRNRGRVAGVDVSLDDRARRTPAGERYLTWAVQGACELVMKLDAGSWQANGVFSPSGPYLDSTDLDLYWHSRNEMIRRLGSEKLLYPHVTSA
ncbi:hypothetical protein [Bradyrhizobium sp. JYMT SZCCT0180]|uniref:hypothetical protein n=1 Tax=Bradyrhizobium sp. JYMT SZCCT0180 TaxID=2807666 RepID=UPI001BA63F53|nr:hypothetical protein [Bradyrhizobium sp. JYMT SZCCT0180]MBR1209742.1 hypothetical protein [Bradyrhizobium sp. JYMT SZCCT0180]